MESLIKQFNSFAENYLPKIITALIVLVIGYLIIKVLLKLIKRIFLKSRIEHTVTTFLFSIIKIVAYAILAITALATIGVNVSSIITTFAAAALTAGLALQESLGNVASGVVILINKPFVSGDILEFEGIKGRIESIRIFSTTLHTFDNKIVTIPNSRLTSNNVVNCTMVDKRRIDLSYTISYDDDIDKVKSIIYGLISKVDKILKDPSPSVCVGEYKDSGIEIIVWVWVNPDDYYEVYYFMQENVKKLFDENGITIPYPHLVIKNN